MNLVFVLDTNKQILAPCSPRRARLLLKNGKAAVFRRIPFTIILKRPVESTVLPSHRLKIDPGSRTTGLVILNETTGQIIFAAELTHRGQQIKAALESRQLIRRNRRNRKTRYRQSRFLNRTRPPGWIAPSLQSRINNIMTWRQRLSRLCPITALSQELVRFDTQLMQNPDISGVEYQHGTLMGCEVWEYLLEKWGRACVYCKQTNVPLQKEHMIPKTRGGSNRVSNLVPACEDCNQKKGYRTAAEFGFPQLQAHSKVPLKDAAAVNTTRWALYRALCETGLPVEVGTGGRTKYNRVRLGLSKSHWADAACVGASTPDKLDIHNVKPQFIRAMGHGVRQMCQTNKYGFPVKHRTRQKQYFGLRTGDLVKTVVPKGKYTGTWISRVIVKAKGNFTIFALGVKASVNHKHCTRLFAADGYAYV